MPAEATAITAVQRSQLASVPALAGVLDDLAADAMATAWEAAITRPPLASFRVLVALDGAGDVVGFAAVGPSDDQDAEYSDALVAEFRVGDEEPAPAGAAPRADERQWSRGSSASRSTLSSASSG